MYRLRIGDYNRFYKGGDAKINIIIFCYLLVAAGFDLWSGKIPNWIVAIGAMGGVIYRVWERGIVGFGLAIFYMLFPIILLYLLFLMRALGAGDIKLFSVIAIWTGIQKSCYVIFCSLLAGAIYGAVKLIYHKSLISSLLRFVQYAGRILSTGDIEPYRTKHTWDKHSIHFALAIAIGFGIASIWEVVFCGSLL